jgi:hypothetical protein
VTAIAAQPFLLQARVAGTARRHVPDFLLVHADKSVRVANVKSAGKLAEPRTAEALAWPGLLFQARGWEHEIWSGADPVLLANLRFLAGYRRAHLLDARLLAEVRRAVPFGTTLGYGFAALPTSPGPLVRAAVLHLLWAGHFAIDLNVPLSERTVLLRGPS